MVVTGFSTTVRKTTLVDATPAKVWKSISQITNLWWAIGVAKTVPLAGPRTGFGAGRMISFDAGNSVKEIITGWKKGEYLSYVALSGLGISAYHATISLKPVRGKTRITWESVFADKDGIVLIQKMLLVKMQRLRLLIQVLQNPLQCTASLSKVEAHLQTSSKPN